MGIRIPESLSVKLQGAVSRGIRSADIDNSGHLIFTLTDNSTVDVGKVVGETGQQGPQGPTGNGIASVSKTGTSGKTDTYTITYTNGTATTFNVTNGNDGEDGSDGVSVTGATVNGSGHLIITLSTGTTVDAGVAKGSDGQDGADGEDGSDGISVTGVTINSSGHLIVTLSSGSSIDAGMAKGDSGVYIGSTPPTDPSVKVWIDTSGEAGDVEMTANKTTSISSASTDTQYPSARSVYRHITANPTLAGTEADLTGLQVGETKYKVSSGEVFKVNFNVTTGLNTFVSDKTAEEIYAAYTAGKVIDVTVSEGPTTLTIHQEQINPTKCVFYYVNVQSIIRKTYYTLNGSSGTVSVSWIYPQPVQDDDLETESDTIVGAINEIYGSKVDKVTGKGLSTQDYTTREKRTLANVSELLKGNEYTLETGTSPVYTDTVQTGAQKWAELGMVGGKSVVWNQLFSLTNATRTSNGITFVINNGIVTANGTSTGTAIFTLVANQEISANHKLLITGCPNDGSVSTYRINGQFVGDTTVYYNEMGSGQIKTVPNGTVLHTAYITISSGVTVSNLVFKPQIFDLTKMFGAGNEPTTVEAFRAMFPLDYYSYDEGSVLHGKCDKVVSQDSDNVLISEYSIPSAVQNLNGYGWSAGTVYNEVNFETKKYIKRVGSVNLSTLSWVYDTQLNRWTNTGAITDMKSNSARNADMVSNKYICTTSASATVAGMFNYMKYLFLYGLPQSESPTGTLYYELATPVETDIGTYITDDVFLDTEVGGSVTFHQQNDTRLLLPNTATYMVKVSDAI